MKEDEEGVWFTRRRLKKGRVRGGGLVVQEGGGRKEIGEFVGEEKEGKKRNVCRPVEK